MRFSHDGRPFLAYESRAWLIDDDDAPIRPAWRESGFWRPGQGPDDVEVVLASNTGQSLLYTGHAGELRWEIATATATPRPDRRGGRRRAPAVRAGGGRRRSAQTSPTSPNWPPTGVRYAPHLNARLAAG